MSRWFGLSERLPRFLSEREADLLYHEGMRFITTHMQLTRLSVQPLAWKGTGLMFFSSILVFSFGQTQF